GPADLVSDRVDQQRHVRQPASSKVSIGQGDDLRICSGIGTSDYLDSELTELSEPPGLRPAVPPHCEQVVGLERSPQLLPVGKPSANYGSRSFGAKGERAPSLVLEGVHLLGDDVRGLAGGPREQFGALEGRCVHVAKAVQTCD